MTAPLLRLWFCLLAATFGAAAADPIVEFASNAGWFGPGSFTDHSNRDVLPALAIAFAGLLLWSILRVRKLLGKPSRVPQWIRRSSLAIESQPITALLPLIFGLQVGVLFAMETIEQVAVYGHVLGPITWLGGPAAASLTVHAVAGLLAAFMLRRAVRKLTAAILKIASLVSSLFTLLPLAENGAFPAPADVPFVRPFAPLPCRIGERAPPHSA